MSSFRVAAVFFALAILVWVLFVALTDDAHARSCVTTRAIVVVDLDDARHAHVIDHALDARRAGQPWVLHIARGLAAEHRRESLKGIPTKPGFDRDEYAPAMSLEGGRGADVRYVKSAENRSAGSVMRAQLSVFCEGQRFAVERDGFR